MKFIFTKKIKDNNNNTWFRLPVPKKSYQPKRDDYNDYLAAYAFFFLRFFYFSHFVSCYQTELSLFGTILVIADRLMCQHRTLKILCLCIITKKEKNYYSTK